MSTVPDMPYQSERRARKAFADKSNSVSAVKFLYICSVIICRELSVGRFP